MGHYLSDANVPLHTNSNYNGQHSNQYGIHALWESRIPELLFEDFDLYIGKANYIENIFDHIWKVVKTSHFLSKELLTKEKLFRKKYSKFKIYSLEKKKGSDDYSSMMPDPEMMNKFMLYGMPVMVGVFTFTLPAGIGVYWGVSTLFAIGQQLFVNKIIKK